MFVLTADQRASTKAGERVEELLAALPDLPGLVRRAERTVGDEVQAVLDDPGDTLRLTLLLQRLGNWATGIGVGDIDNLAATSRASSGPAFIHAREAVERAKSRSVPVPIAVSAANAEGAREVESLLHLIAAVVRRRSDTGWEVVDRLAQDGRTQTSVAHELAISQQAVSQRLAAGLWVEENGVHPLAIRLLSELEKTP
ncbi:MAG: hypothetical protein ACK5H2_04300 [Beutenbergiaceae bacterium]